METPGAHFGGVMRSAILCPGPSLKDVEIYGLNDWKPFKYILAVNGAIHSPLPWTHWIIADQRSVKMHWPPPDRPYTLLHPDGWMQLESKNVESKRYQPHLQEYMDKVENISMYNTHAIAMANDGLTYRDVRAATFLHGIGWLVDQGSTEIEVYGCDLQGSDYYAKDDNWYGEGLHTKRWIEQGRCLERLTKSLARVDIILRRVYTP
jgi:hypothetical protein